MKIFSGVCSLVLVTISTTLCLGQATTINSGNWNTAANWSTGTVPTSTTAVTVNHAMNLSNISVQAKYIFNAASSGNASINMSADSLIINANVAFNNSGNNLTGGVILVKSGATFTIGSFSTGGSFKLVIEPGATVVVNGSINNNGGTIQVDGTLTVNGSYSAANNNGNITGTGNFTTTGSMTSMNGGTIFGNPNQSCSSNCDGTNLCGVSLGITPNASSICSGATLSFTSTVSPAPTSYEWQSSAINGGYTAIASATNDSYSASVTNSAYYRLKVVSSGCSSYSMPVAITIHTLPSPPTSSDVTQCGGGAVTLTASGSPDYAWYNDAQKTTLLDSDNSYTTPTLSSSGSYSYFVTAIDLNDCESTPLEVHITINDLPAAPTVPDVSRCGTGTVTLNASGSTGVYNWYQDALKTYLLSSGPGSFTSPSLFSDGGYYVTAVDGDCESEYTLALVDIQECTGVTESSSANGVEVYVSGKKLYVNTTASTERTDELSIFNMQGKEMNASNTLTENGLNIISLEHFQTGIYMIKIKAGENSVARRVMVE